MDCDDNKNTHIKQCAISGHISIKTITLIFCKRLYNVK